MPKLIGISSSAETFSHVKYLYQLYWHGGLVSLIMLRSCNSKNHTFRENGRTMRKDEIPNVIRFDNDDQSKFSVSSFYANIIQREKSYWMRQR